MVPSYRIALLLSQFFCMFPPSKEVGTSRACFISGTRIEIGSYFYVSKIFGGVIYKTIKMVAILFFE